MINGLCFLLFAESSCNFFVNWVVIGMGIIITGVWTLLFVVCFLSFITKMAILD